MVAELRFVGRLVDTRAMSTPDGTMPVMSGEDMHLHNAVEYWEGVQAALAHASILKAAMGMEPDESRKIVDIDPSQLPVLPPEHP